ncbi:sulfatase [Streptomyces sp. NPDC056821]|uniref:sulfatase n=1 Tax=unclassified Streptomyces TaxID=2593676 RepID=UPI00365C91CE
MTEMMPPTRLRRLPWSEDGKPAYLSTGGGASFLAHLADVMEEGMLTTAEVDGERANAIADDVSASRAELRFAVRYLSHAVADAVEVARLRGERLDLDPEALNVGEALRRDLGA